MEKRGPTSRTGGPRYPHRRAFFSSGGKVLTLRKTILPFPLRWRRSMYDQQNKGDSSINSWQTDRGSLYRRLTVRSQRLDSIFSENVDESLYQLKTFHGVEVTGFRCGGLTRGRGRQLSSDSWGTVIGKALSASRRANRLFAYEQFLISAGEGLRNFSDFSTVTESVVTFPYIALRGGTALVAPLCCQYAGRGDGLHGFGGGAVLGVENDGTYIQEPDLCFERTVAGDYLAVQGFSQCLWDLVRHGPFRTSGT